MKKYKSLYEANFNVVEEFEDFVYSQGITDPKKSDVNDFVKQYKLNNSQKK